jgi:PleD family two-component response regulator
LTSVVLGHAPTLPPPRLPAPSRHEPPIRVLIADDHQLFAQALEAILAPEQHVDVVGYARDGHEAVELAR